MEIEGRYDCESKYTLTEGLEALKRNRYDLIILDVNLPDKSYKLNQELVELKFKFRIPLLILTGHEESITTVAGLSGYDTYLCKDKMEDLTSHIDFLINVKCRKV